MKLTENCLVFGFFFLFNLTLTTVQAQTQPSFLGVQHSVSVSSARQELNDPILFSGPARARGEGLGYQYLMEGRKRKSALTMDYGKAGFATKEGEWKQHALSLSLSDGFAVFHNKKQTILGYIGYSLATVPSFMTGKKKDVNAYAWNTQNELSLYQSYVYRWKANRFDLSVNIPLAALTYRPDSVHAISGDNTVHHVLNTVYSNASFVSISDYRAINLTLRYQRRLTDRLNFAAQYNFQYKELKSVPYKTNLGALGLSLVYTPAGD